jgi:hypothetical protein
MPRPHGKRSQPVEGRTEVITAEQFFTEVLREPPELSYDNFPHMLYLYICPQCGWWTISTGVDETFGSLVRHPGPRTEPCEKCQFGPMRLVKRDDPLYVVVETQPEENKP